MKMKMMNASRWTVLLLSFSLVQWLATTVGCEEENDDNDDDDYEGDDNLKTDADWQSELISDVFYNRRYSMWGVPPSLPVNIELGLSILCAQLDEKTKVLSTSAWLFQSWVDDRLTWDPNDYNGIDSIRVPFWHTWRPDIKLYNAIEPTELEYTNSIVFCDGTIIWVPPVFFKTLCAENKNASTRYQKTYSCHLKFGSWTYDGSQLPLSTFDDDNGVYLNEYTSACPTSIRDIHGHIESKEYECCPNQPYQSLDVYFELKPK